MTSFSFLKRYGRQAAEHAPHIEARRAFQLIIAGGGTGGHLFPGIAIAEEVLSRNRGNRVLFIGSGNPFETATLAAKGFDQERITIRALKGMGVFKQLSALLGIPAGIHQSVGILRRYRPDLVLGLGGYSSGPVVVAAWLMGIPRVLHEQNVLPGITNRLLAGLADRVYVSFENTRFKRCARKLKLTGNPVRKEFLESLHATARDSAAEPDAGGTSFTVLIVGGSQGAHGVNMAVLEALEHLGPAGRYAFIHQTGKADEALVREAYAERSIRADVRAFFDDMAEQYRRADMVICRAGATTIAELTVMGKGVLFIPYPYAADDHQARNAAGLVLQQAAEMIRENELNGRMLAQKIEAYATSPRKLAAMAANARALGRPQASRTIVDDMYLLIGFDI